MIMRTERLSDGREILLGFNNIDEALDYSRTIDGEVCLYERKDGADAYRSRGIFHLDINVMEFYSNDDRYTVYRNYQDEEEFFRHVVCQDLCTLDTLDEAQAMLRHYKKVWEHLSECGDDEFLLVDASGFMEIMKKYSMSHHKDNVSYEVGVIDMRQYDVQ